MLAHPSTLRGLGPTIAATSFGFVVVRLDVTTALQWVVDAYTLTFAVLLLAAGVLADRLGARRLYLAGFALFAVASAACGLCEGTHLLIGARAIQGIAAALMVPSSLTLLNHATRHEPSLRARAVGLWTAAGGVSIAVGPLAGALLLEAFGWRSIFFVNVPLCALAARMIVRHVPAIPHAVGTAGSRHSWLLRLDPVGQLLAIVALSALTGALIEMHALGAADGRIVAAFGLAIFAAVAFCLIETRVPTPMLPPGLFALPAFSAAVVFGILVNLTYYGVLFALSLYLQRALAYTAMQAGLAYLPLTATLIVSNLVSGRLVAGCGPRLPMLIGAIIAACGYALLARLDATSSWWTMLAPFTLIPFGMGLAVPAMTTTILATVERSRTGTASAVLNAARQAGGTVGVAVFGALVAGDAAEIVSGLQRAAMISSGLLGVAALLVFFGIGGAAPGRGRRAHQEGKREQSGDDAQATRSPRGIGSPRLTGRNDCAA